VSCGPNNGNTEELTATPVPIEATQAALLTRLPSLETPTPSVPLIDVSLGEQDLTIAPLPLRAGFPFTVTAVIHNHGLAPATDMPLILYISADQEELGYTPY
jgi:hypothetical protein